MSVSSSSKAWMLGPKAENEQEFERLFLQVFRDYCHWRRNFHPEDAPFVTAGDRLDEGFQGYFEGLQDRLFEMLARLKRSVPFFSPRYLGHMVTDLLIPGVLGYTAGMLYNQNNIVAEAGTITLQLEAEAMQLVAAMLGLPKESCWGHLCSGGTAANLESLWVARNLKLLPYQVALTIHELGPDDSRARKLKDCPAGSKGSFGECLEAANLATLTVADVLGLREAVARCCAEDPDLAKCIDASSLEVLGLTTFSERCRASGGAGFPKHFRLLMSRNAHYSLRKAANILGFGRRDIVELPLDDSFRLDTNALFRSLQACAEEGEAIIAVVGVCGSTEEGSIDDFSALTEIREAARYEGRPDFWLHGDACYGGYALSLLHPGTVPTELGELLNSHVTGARNHGRLKREAGGVAFAEKWLSEWCQKATSFGRCDSISIDPHKLGYIPYPAGAVFYGDYRVRELIRVDAPYINAATSDDAEGSTEPAADVWNTPYLGKYTLEGSRPGAYGAATWLAHTTVPLDRTGHGAIVGATMAAVRVLAEAIEEEFEIKGNGLSCHFLCPEPDLNIACYTFGGVVNGEPLPLAVVNRVVKRLYDELLPTEAQPTHTRDFVVAMTSLSSHEYGDVLDRFLRRTGMGGRLFESRADEAFNPWKDDVDVSLIRTVVMGPFLLGAETRPRAAREKQDLARTYARFLRERVTKLIEEERRRPLPEGLRPSLPGLVLVLEDDLVMREDLIRQLAEVSFVDTGRVRHAPNLELAKEIVAQGGIAGATVDIQLEGKGRGGIEFLESMARKPGFKGAVVFTGVGSVRHEVEQLAKTGGFRVDFHEKPSHGDGRFEEAMNRVMESLWRILNDK